MKNTQDSTPPVPDALVKELERLFPEKCPDLNTPEREIWAYSGKRELVRLIVSWHQSNLKG